MKTHFKIFAIIALTITFSFVNHTQVSAQQDNVSIQVFYDQLSPYGQWINNSEYGYVWFPETNSDFAPYATSGHWVMTIYGWTWLSDYEWGWAPFHYGRWDYDDNYGWFWIPDYEWGPAWVIWRQASGYYGWTPMRPGINISLSFGNGYGNINRWNFVSNRYFGRSDMNRYYVDRNRNNTIIVNSTVINNTYVDKGRNTKYISGPRRADVQKNTGRTINNVTIRNNTKPGQRLSNNQLEMYRPQVKRNNDINRKPIPSRISTATDIKPIKDRNMSLQQKTIVNQQQRQVNQQRNSEQQKVQLQRNTEQQQKAKQQQDVQQQRNVEQQQRAGQQQKVNQQRNVEQQQRAGQQQKVNQQRNVEQQQNAQQQRNIQQKKVEQGQNNAKKVVNEKSNKEDAEKRR